jgi:nucleobase:cation symporter-1, NCS1 family
VSVFAEEEGSRFGHSSYWLWLAVVFAVCTGLALGGPILLVRRWLERFGAWVVAAVAAWITIRVLQTANLGAVWARPGQGGIGFWLGVDLAVAMPVSWLPLVADYNRFARAGVSSAAGTFWGYAAGNFWFYSLGALLVLGAGMSDTTPAGLGTAIASLAGGWVVLLALLVGETDEAFADIYSAAVSSQNLEERIPQRGAILAVATAGLGLAVWLGLRPTVALGDYESFLLLLGSVFVPLFGVFVADYFLLGRRGPRQGRRGGWAFAAWALGFVAYQWSVPVGPAAWQGAVRTVLHGWLNLPFPLAGSAAGASIPAFFVAMAVYVLAAGPAASAGRGISRRPRGGSAAGPP